MMEPYARRPDAPDQRIARIAGRPGGQGWLRLGQDAITDLCVAAWTRPGGRRCRADHGQLEKSGLTEPTGCICRAFCIPRIAPLFQILPVKRTARTCQF